MTVEEKADAPSVPRASVEEARQNRASNVSQNKLPPSESQKLLIEKEALVFNYTNDPDKKFKEDYELRKVVGIG